MEKKRFGVDITFTTKDGVVLSLEETVKEERGEEAGREFRAETYHLSRFAMKKIITKGDGEGFDPLSGLARKSRKDALCFINALGEELKEDGEAIFTEVIKKHGLSGNQTKKIIYKKVLESLEQEGYISCDWKRGKASIRITDIKIAVVISRTHGGVRVTISQAP